MNKLFFWIAFVVGFVVGGLILAYYSNNITQQSTLGLENSNEKSTFNLPLSQIDLVDLNGDSINLSQFNDRHLVLNFWGTWCKPCIEEMPDLDLLRNSKRFHVILISGENIEKIREFQAKHSYGFIYLKSKKPLALYSINQYPQTFVIHKEKGIVKRIVGQILPSEVNEIDKEF